MLPGVTVSSRFSAHESILPTFQTFRSTRELIPEFCELPYQSRIRDAKTQRLPSDRAPRNLLKSLGTPTKAGGGSFSDDDYFVTARWGIAGKGGITMPAKGRVVMRPRDAAEQTALGDAAALLGDETCDVYLNDAAYWKNVPRPVWDYTLGGYQVLKKWLSYRESSLLGRALTPDEMAYFHDVVRRIAAMLLLGPKLNANYAAVKADPYAWPESFSTSP